MSTTTAAGTATGILVYVRTTATSEGQSVAHVLSAHAVMLGWPEAVGERRLIAGLPLCGSAPRGGVWRVVSPAQGPGSRRPDALCRRCEEATWQTKQ
jgi:hypothetical protein